MKNDFSHYPVLYNEVITLLNIKDGGTYLDGTMGGAGHAAAILEHCAPKGRLLALDRDAEAIKVGTERLAVYGGRAIIVQANFADLAEQARSFAPAGLNGVLLDIGCSSPQLDDGKRGFSYMHDGPLDMRMDRRQTVTAADICNTYSAEQLTEIFYTFGEEKWAKRIAEFIVAGRQKKPLAGTLELVTLIKQAVPVGARDKDQHPAKRIFQALRIAVNDELGALNRGLEGAVSVLKPGGRLAVITFHSLEDRIVKEKFRYFAADCVCPPHQPICTCGKLVTAKIITRKPILPSARELNENPRSRSAKLRVCEKV